MKYSMNEVIKELCAGICELTLVDEFSVETGKVMGTLAECHMANEGDVEKARWEKSAEGERVNVWNVREERWEKIRLVEIGEIERLTGAGVGKKSETEMNLEEFLAEAIELINMPEDEEKRLAKEENSDRITD